MKKVPLLFALVVMMCMPWAARADQHELLVGVGNEANQIVPFYGDQFRSDNATYHSQHTQIIYPASMLTAMANNAIFGIEWFYKDENFTGNGHNKWGVEVTISLAIVPDTVLTTLLTPTTLTDVWHGVIQGNPFDDHITFEVPYEYTSGNLLVDIQTGTSGSHCVEPATTVEFRTFCPKRRLPIAATPIALPLAIWPWTTAFKRATRPDLRG